MKDATEQLRELYSTLSDADLYQRARKSATPIGETLAKEELTRRGLKAAPDQSAYAGGARINGDQWRESQKIAPNV